jgi:hypothetical protein
MRLRKDIADQFHEIIVAIVGEEILGLNGHQLLCVHALTLPKLLEA